MAARVSGRPYKFREPEDETPVEVVRQRQLERELQKLRAENRALIVKPWLS